MPRRYLDLIEPGNPDDPLLLQILATGREREAVPGYNADPLDESRHTPVPGLLHSWLDVHEKYGVLSRAECLAPAIDLAKSGLHRDAIPELKAHLLEGLDARGFEVIGPRSGANASGITSFTHQEHPNSIPSLFEKLAENDIVASFRHDREGVPYIRFSPHFYNTHAEIDRVFATIDKAGT